MSVSEGELQLILTVELVDVPFRGVVSISGETVSYFYATMFHVSMYIFLFES
jgi:hypothetical protein